MMQVILPKRWYIYSVDLEPRIGTKPGKQRPCLAVQPSEFCMGGLKSTVILPLTSKIIKDDLFPLRVRIPADVAGLLYPSDVLVDQILSWDNSLFRKELGILPEPLIIKIQSALKDFLDLE